MIVKLLTEHHLEFLSLKGGCGGLSESTLVKMSNCLKSHALAHLLSLLVFLDVHRHHVIAIQETKIQLQNCAYNVYRKYPEFSWWWCYDAGSQDYVIVIPWVVRRYVEIIHEL